MGLDYLSTRISACENLGKLTGARDLYEEILPIRRHKLGNDHIATVLIMNNLTVTYTDLRQFDKAEVLHREVLAVLRGLNRVEHRDTLRMAYYPVITYLGLKKLKDAEGLLVEILPIFDRMPGELVVHALKRY